MYVEIFQNYFFCKLMRSKRPPAKIRSKSYSNRILSDFFDPISAVRSIVAMFSIWIQISIL